MTVLHVPCLLIVALLASTGARADDMDTLSPRIPVVRAPTSGRAVSTILPLEMRAGGRSDLYFAPLEEPAKVQSTSKPKNSCIKSSSISAADVRDDSTIRLTVAKNKQVDMKLYGICPGLAFDESFYYQPGPTMELCARIDTIVARSGSRCLIDAFVPVEPKHKK
jgi:hypothetical protein